VNQTFEPRKVERPFIGRWLGTSLRLLIRSPLHFGSAIVFLVCIDNAVAQLATTYRIGAIWAHAVGSLLLGLVWVFIAALARGADDPSRIGSALRHVVQPKVWIGASASAAVIVCMQMVFLWTLAGAIRTHGHMFSETLEQPGDLVACIDVDAAFVSLFFDPFYFPLLALVPGIAAMDARSLSKRAARINGSVVISLGFGLIIVPPILVAEVVPVFGLILATTLTFLGVFNYVAYRDVFERRADNEPQRVGSITPDLCAER
jgi:hypothetical protein